MKGSVIGVEAHGMKPGHSGGMHVDRIKRYGHDVTHGTVAQMFAFGAGVLLLVAGIVGMILNADFSTGDAISTEALLFMDVNGWSSLLMIVTGGVLLVGRNKADRARTVSLAVGVVYLALTVWSLIDNSILGAFPVNDMTAIVYAAIGVLGVTAGLGPERQADGS